MHRLNMHTYIIACKGLLHYSMYRLRMHTAGPKIFSNLLLALYYPCTIRRK